jgi:hypothetical protein
VSDARAEGDKRRRDAATPRRREGGSSEGDALAQAASAHAQAASAHAQALDAALAKAKAEAERKSAFFWRLQDAQRELERFVSERAAT